MDVAPVSQRSIIDGMAVPVWLSDPEGRFNHVNQRWLEFTGRTAEDELGSGWAQGIHADDVASVMQAWQHAVSQQLPFTAHYRHRRHDGAYCWLTSEGAPYVGADGSFAGYVGVLLNQDDDRDVHEHAERAFREAWEAPQANREHFEALLLLNALPCNVGQVAEDGHVDFVNAHWLEYTGLTVEEAQAAGGAIAVHPEDVAEFERLRASLSDGQPVEGEMRIRRRDGAYRWHMARAAPVRHDGRVAWVWATADIDDRKRREGVTEFLSDAGKVLSECLDVDVTLRTITELAVPRLADWCKIDLIDEESGIKRVAYSNADPARMAMATEAQKLLAEHVKEMPQADRVIRTGSSELVEDLEPLVSRLVTAKPESASLLTAFDFRSSLAVAIKTRGRTLGALTLVTAESGRRLGRDDVELAEEFARRLAIAVDHALLYQNLTAALQAKNEFLSLVSHELRTPLTTLTGTARVLRRHGDQMEAADRIQALRDLEIGAEWLSRIVENMLNLAHAENRNSIELEPQLLRRLIGTMVAEQRDQFPGHEVVLTAAEDLLPVLANAEYVQQIMANLLSNARKYSSPGQAIDVLIEREGDFAAVTVSDRGIGLDQSQLTEIFEPFFRSEEGASRASGIGLGLTVCKRLVELQGGHIRALARPGGGSSFRFTLPLAPEYRDAGEG